MKLFGWGKSKLPQPQSILQQVKKTDPRNSSHGPDRGITMGLSMPCRNIGGSGNARKQQGLFGVDVEDGYLLEGVGNGQDASCDEKLQDTIRFVFSHEQEGLLVIGTFALEQLAAIRDTVDNHRKPAGNGFESCTDMMQSSDEEDRLPRSLKTSCELPLDFYTSGAESDEGHQFLRPTTTALTLYKGNRSPVAGMKPIVLLTALPPELRKSLHPASPWLHSKSPTYVPLGHWTDSVPPQVALPKAHVDQEYYSSYFCGLISSKKRSPRCGNSKQTSTRKEIVHFQQEDPKNFTTKPMDQNTKKSLPLKFGTPSLEKLKKFWRSSCKQSSARIAPERKPCSPRASQEFKGAQSNEIKSGEVLTAPETPHLGSCDNRISPPGWLLSDVACSPEVAEFRRRVAMHERFAANADEERRDGDGSSRGDGGRWIKTDSEYVVLEM